MNKYVNSKISHRYIILLLIALACALSLGFYIYASVLKYRMGFPLDDAWIHQTYARNLGKNGEWAFIPGLPSAGSTAPLFSALLSIGYWLSINHYLWTFFIGWITLFGLAVVGMLCFKLLCPSRSAYAPWVAIFLALEWHLVWAAGSGMETLLFALISLGVITYLMRGGINWFVIGLLIGLSTWLRPDGITLLGPASVILFLNIDKRKSRILEAVKLILGVGMIFGPYLLFNRYLAGAWWPNTFFAKQAEYASLRSQPIIKRIADQMSLPLIGSGILLLPGFVLSIYDSFHRRAWGQIVGPLWFLGYLLMYALRLPVTYQHGRYIIPAMPVFFVWSLAGMAGWIRLGSSDFRRRLISRAWVISVGLITVVFWVFGLRAYALDVAIIESEMVDTAFWISENTNPNVLIAAHDIGALGYYGKRQIIDLAGLVSPEVIPFIRDEDGLEAFINSSQADYLVTFPGWYPYLVSRSTQVFSTNSGYSPLLGGENMAVYHWQSR